MEFYLGAIKIIPNKKQILLNKKHNRIWMNSWQHIYFIFLNKHREIKCINLNSIKKNIFIFIYIWSKYMQFNSILFFNLIKFYFHFFFSISFYCCYCWVQLETKTFNLFQWSNCNFILKNIYATMVVQHIYVLAICVCWKRDTFIKVTWKGLIFSQNLLNLGCVCY